MNTFLIPVVAGLLLGAIFATRIFVLRHRAVDAQTRRAADHRKPVLYLRSFQEDESKHTHPFTGARYEEYIASVLEEIGPVIAIGRPGEELPPIGAARMYVKGENWQQEVLSLMATAQIVLIQADVTRGLLWEIASAAKSVSPERLLISLPYIRSKGRIPKKSLRQESYTRFKSGVAGVFPRPLPEAIKDATFICFKADWTPQLLNPPAKWKTPVLGQNPWTRVGVRETIRPYCLRLGTRLSKRQTIIKGLLVFPIGGVVQAIVFTLLGLMLFGYAFRLITALLGSF